MEAVTRTKRTPTDWHAAPAGHTVQDPDTVVAPAGEKWPAGHTHGPLQLGVAAPPAL